MRGLIDWSVHWSIDRLIDRLIIDYLSTKQNKYMDFTKIMAEIRGNKYGIIGFVWMLTVN